MYRDRMLSYYPNSIKSILEFNAIIDAEFPEIEGLSTDKELVISDAYFTTMSEQRVIKWEKLFGIQPFPNATIEDRRNNVIARILGQGKLNTSLINAIVKTSTGQGCNCRIEGSTLYVELLPFDESKGSLTEVINNITNELELKIPAHLGLDVKVSYIRWSDVYQNNNSWTTVRATHGTWEDVLFGRTKKANMLDISKLDEFYLG